MNVGQQNNDVSSFSAKPPPSQPIQPKPKKIKKLIKPVKVLTGYIIKKLEAVADVLVYDILISWIHEQLLAHNLHYGAIPSHLILDRRGNINLPVLR
jgi:hypothetical protein